MYGLVVEKIRFSSLSPFQPEFWWVLVHCCILMDSFFLRHTEADGTSINIISSTASLIQVFQAFLLIWKSFLVNVDWCLFFSFLFNIDLSIRTCTFVKMCDESRVWKVEYQDLWENVMKLFQATWNTLTHHESDSGSTEFRIFISSFISTDIHPTYGVTIHNKHFSKC